MKSAVENGCGSVPTWQHAQIDGSLFQQQPETTSQLVFAAG
jgi:hypothetical protein